jgi:hypothetical protein
VKHADPPARKPYSAPRLVTYGDLRVITENKNRAGSDGGGGGGKST